MADGINLSSLDEMLTALDAELRVVARELERIEHDERLLAERRASLEARRSRANEAVSRVRDRLWQWDGERPSGDVSHTLPLFAMPVGKTPLWSIVRDIMLEIRGRELTADQIVKELAAHNYKIKSPNARELVRTALKRKGDVFHCEDGKFSLIEDRPRLNGDGRKRGIELTDD